MSIISEENFQVTVNGFSIKAKTLYQITPKPDGDALDGYREHRTTKILDPVAGTHTIPFAVWDDEKGVYDTGLYMNSRALRKLYPDEKQRKQVVNLLTKNIVVPVENIKGENVLDHKNNEFWDEASIILSKDRILDTSNAIDLLALYSAILHGNLAPEGEEDSPKYKNKAQFCVQNKESVMELKHKKDLERNQAIGMFFVLLKDSKEQLVVLLDYLGISSSDNPDDAALNSTFTQWLNDKDSGYQNASEFNRVYDLFQTPEGKEEIMTFSNLKKLFRAGRIRKAAGTLYLGDSELGGSFKTAAKAVMKSKELQEEVFNLLE